MSSTTNFLENIIFTTPNKDEEQTTMTTTTKTDNLIDRNGLELYYDLTSEDADILCKLTREILERLIATGQVEPGATDCLGDDTFPLPVQNEPQEQWLLSEVKQWYAEMQRKRAFDFFYNTFYARYKMGEWDMDCQFDDPDEYSEDSDVIYFLDALFEGAEDNWGIDDKYVRPWRYEEEDEAVAVQQIAM